MGQAELAERLDVTQSAISKWEHGSMPLAKYRKKLAKLFCVTEEELKGWLENAGGEDGTRQHVSEHQQTDLRTG